MNRSNGPSFNCYLLDKYLKSKSHLNIQKNTHLYDSKHQLTHYEEEKKARNSTSHGKIFNLSNGESVNVNWGVSHLMKRSK